MGVAKCPELRNSRWTHVSNEHYDIPIGRKGGLRQNKMFGNGLVKMQFCLLQIDCNFIPDQNLSST